MKHVVHKGYSISAELCSCSVEKRSPSLKAILDYKRQLCHSTPQRATAKATVGPVPPWTRATIDIDRHFLSEML